MLARLCDMLLAAGVIFLALMFWVAVQRLFRRMEQLPPDCDVIGDTDRGKCAHCAQQAACTQKPTASPPTNPT